MTLAALLLLAYLLGSASGSLLLGRVVGVDIRQSGSGNAGGTNAFRTRGWRFALGVVLIDIGKGVLAACLPWLFGLPPAMLPVATCLCVLAAVAGHTWPVFFGFRGGKGAATLMGGLLIFWPWALVVLLATWVGVLVLSGYVGLATVIAALVLLPCAWLDPGPAPAVRIAFSLVASGLIVFTHRGNLQRLWRGEEYRFEKIRLFRRRRGAP